MKFKVVFRYTGGSGSSGQSMSNFYTRAQAVSAAQQWRELGSGYYASYWDGTSWTQYNPIP